MQSDARLAVYKIRLADSFLSTDRGRYLYWVDAALGTLNWALLPEGAHGWPPARRTAPRRTWAWGRRRPTTGCAGACAGAARKSWTGWWWRRSRSWTWRSGRTWPAWNADVKFLLLGDFRQLPAVLDSWAGRPISAPLEHSQLSRDLAGGHRHELTENMRSDPGIFNFVKWLRVGEEACPTLEQAKARLKELYPSKPGWPDTTLVISHSKHMAVNAAANRALAPEASKLLELEVIHMGCYESVPTETPQNSPQSMRVAGAAPHWGRRKDTQVRPHAPGLHKRAAPAARELRGARHAVAGRVPEGSAPSPSCTSRACPWRSP